MKLSSIAVLLATIIASPSARAQYLQGEDAVNALKGQLQNSINQNQQGIANMVQQAMQDPQCWAAYQQFTANGGQMPYQTFAYQWVATAHFSAAGKQNYWNSQRAIERRDAQNMQDYRQSEAARGQAQMEMQQAYGAGQSEQGRILQGNRTYTDPYSGQVVLPYQNPGTVSVDQRTGRSYMMDQNGRYSGYDQNGNEYDLSDD